MFTNVFILLDSILMSAAKAQILTLSLSRIMFTLLCPVEMKPCLSFSHLLSPFSLIPANSIHLFWRSELPCCSRPEGPVYWLKSVRPTMRASTLGTSQSLLPWRQLCTANHLGICHHFTYSIFFLSPLILPSIALILQETYKTINVK